MSVTNERYFFRNDDVIYTHSMVTGGIWDLSIFGNLFCKRCLSSFHFNYKTIKPGEILIHAKSLRSQMIWNCDNPLSIHYVRHVVAPNQIKLRVGCFLWREKKLWKVYIFQSLSLWCFKVKIICLKQSQAICLLISAIYFNACSKDI